MKTIWSSLLYIFIIHIFFPLSCIAGINFEMDPQYWGDSEEENSKSSESTTSEQYEDRTNILQKNKDFKYLSLNEIAKIIYDEAETASEDYSSYSDDDSTDSDDADYSENSYLDDPYAEREPISKREQYYYDAPAYLAYPQQEKIDDIYNFLKACKIGFDDKTVSDFLEKYQGNKNFLDSIMNDTFPTPLFWAVINGNTFMVKKLLPYVIFDNPFDRSALFYAVLFKKKEIVKYLLSSTRDVSPDDPALRYHPHIDHISRTQTLKKFLASKPYLKWTTYSPLRAALRNNDFEMVKLLIDYGAKDKRSIITSTIPQATDPRILNLLVQHNFLSPKLIEQKLFFSKNKIHYRKLYEDKQYDKLCNKKKSLSLEEFNDQLIRIMQKYIIA